MAVPTKEKRLALNIAFFVNDARSVVAVATGSTGLLVGVKV